MEANDNSDNVYAHTTQGNVIHISEVSYEARGRRGYFCIGCTKEMQAIKPQIRSPHFRHDAKAVKFDKKCTYSDETYRHKLAKDILQIIKRIKVPAIYKYPPRGIEGRAMLLKEPEFIIAHKVKNELTFYENENCEIFWGSNADINNRYHLIKPDVTFFNADNYPILFIEIVSTHKITEEKLLKIKRLGIDTIQVTIPKDSPQAIEKSFSSVERVTWVYNNLQENTEYVSTTNGNTEGVSFADEIPAQLYEESFKCRAAQIRNLTRRIKQCLESKPYRQAESNIRSEIQRVEEATRREQEQLSRFDEDYQIQCESDISAEKERINKLSDEVRHRYSELEARYRKEAAELDKQEQTIDRSRAGIIEPIESETRRIIEELSIIGERRDKATRDINLSERAVESIRRDILEQPELNREAENRIRRGIDDLKNNERSEISKFEREEAGLPEQFERNRRLLAEKYSEGRRNDAGTGQNGYTTTDEFERKRKRLIEGASLYKDFEQAVLDRRRIIKAKKCIDEDRYKDWIDREPILRTNG